MLLVFVQWSVAKIRDTYEPQPTSFPRRAWSFIYVRVLYPTLLHPVFCSLYPRYSAQSLSYLENSYEQNCSLECLVLELSNI